MRAVAQRVSSASVTVDGATVAAIEHGMVVLVGVAGGDTAADADTLADKLASIRIFADDQGRMNRAVTDVAGSILVVSQFTLLADAARGRRPSFTAAATPEVAAPLVARIQSGLTERGIPVATGRFGARMAVTLVNDGPVTILLDVSGGRVR
ncbi:MAG: D-tyrosyl-tRNA(Tyr) deacylase [Acidimicrobiia bacterium]|nr:D-tyrosyl-tRNA(Tyr) deacylase [Acidimicrobiia bacterium]